MTTFDMTTLDGLREACREAERRLDEQAETIAQHAEFLQKVHAAGVEERESESFLRLVWEDNPLDIADRGNLDVSAALADRDFRRRFHERVRDPLPEGPSDRTDRLDQALRTTWDELREYVPAMKGGRRERPRWKTQRAFAALFPRDIAPCWFWNLHKLCQGMGMGRRGTSLRPALASRLILDRLDEVIGPVEPSDWNAVARRMRLPLVLHQIRGGVGRADSDLRDLTLSGEAARPELGVLREYFESVREDQGLVFDWNMVESLHFGLWAHERRHFAVLTGLSGTGKTQLAVQYAIALTSADSESSPQICTIPVQPGWHDPAPLLGYVNPLGDNRYAEQEFLRFLIRATESPSEPHVCILDEMNLSHPEQYLAPILSAMEREGSEIPLHGGDAEAYGVPRAIRYPDNLVLIGAVNMDETTMGISDKVLDRAFTLEFWDVDVAEWPGWASSVLAREDKETVRVALVALMDALSPARLHFGWRVIAEVVRFMECRQREDGEMPVGEALDRVVYAKVLPKLRGDDSPRCRRALEDCRQVLEKRRLERSRRKVAELIEDLNETGSFRFWR